MIEIEFPLPKGCDVKRVESTVERSCRSRGLLTALKGSLSHYPGSIHWHFKNSAIQRNSRTDPVSSEVAFMVQGAGRTKGLVDR
jgi:hypothetical protein